MFNLNLGGARGKHRNTYLLVRAWELLTGQTLSNKELGVMASYLAQRLDTPDKNDGFRGNNIYSGLLMGKSDSRWEAAVEQVRTMIVADCNNAIETGRMIQPVNPSVNDKGYARCELLESGYNPEDAEKILDNLPETVRFVPKGKN